MVKGQAFPTGLENPSSCRLREPQSRHLERGNLINPLIIIHNLSLSEILQSLPIRRGEEIILVFSELKGLLNTAHSPYSDKEYPPLPLRWMPEVVPCPRREGKEEKWRAGRGRRR
ncbi:hypothetical protein GW17_00057542 [Ensete ventricosum]|nr:hypothetical protein GW17_00057542 [Ensete ventricosum]